MGRDLGEEDLPLLGIVSLVCGSWEGPAGSREGRASGGRGYLFTHKTRETLLSDNQFYPVLWCAGTRLCRCLSTARYLFRNSEREQVFKRSSYYTLNNVNLC